MKTMGNWNIRIWEYEFNAPQWLWLLVLVPIVLYLLIRAERMRNGDVKFSRSTEDQRSIGSTWITRLRDVLILSLGLSLSLMILALAKPFHWSLNEDTSIDYKYGIDIILTMDVSGSMLARDFEPNRLEAAKQVAKEFIQGRRGDRIGLVVYGENAFTACPATLDYRVLTEQLAKVNIDDRIGTGTAIGTGLGTAVTRLREDTGSGKVIILLTDGRNNSGEITPMTAAELARAKNIRVYTIGMGGEGPALMPQNTVFGTQFVPQEVDIDEATLKKIADLTNGKYFRATDKNSLQNIYKEIETLEKRKLEDQRYKAEPPAHPEGFLNWAFVLLFISVILYTTLFRFND